ncbi:hypothetical protein D3C73_1306430 [compost metagenome]
MISDGNPVGIQVLHIDEFAAFVLAQLHYGTHVVVRDNNPGLDVWLLHIINGSDLRIV